MDGMDATARLGVSRWGPTILHEGDARVTWLDCTSTTRRAMLHLSTAHHLPGVQPLRLNTLSMVPRTVRSAATLAASAP